MLSAVIGEDGLTHDIRVVRPLGLGMDESAIEAVRRWKFAPAMLNGQPVPVHINVEVNFRAY